MPSGSAAALVVGLSVVSLPMLVDCDISAAEAVFTSWRAARANPGVMFRWGVIVAALLVIGSSFFVGLAAVLPWLGYATWHLYTKLGSQRDQVAPRLNLKRRSFRPASRLRDAGRDAQRCATSAAATQVVEPHGGLHHGGRPRSDRWPANRAGRHARRLRRS